SNEEMQNLVAKIIVGEYTVPGRYAMSTLHTLKMLGKNELELFEKICNLLINKNEIPKSLFTLPESARKFLNDLRIDFGSLQILQNLGLFLPNDMSRSLENPEKKDFAIQYFDQQIVFTPANDNFVQIKTPEFYGLSITGKQILQHLDPKFNNDYFEWLKSNYIVPNYKIEVF